MKVTLPQTAVDLLKDVISDNSHAPNTIRVYFAGIGCCGASFGITLDEKNDQDVGCDIEGLHFIMDRDEYEKYGDVTILEVEGGFIISVENTPEEGAQCGSCSGCKY